MSIELIKRVSGGGGTPAGSSGQIQFNTSGSFGADSALYWDNTNKRLSVGPGTSPVARVHLQTASASEKGLIVQAVASQTGNLQEWQDNAGTAEAFVNSGGDLVFVGDKYIYGQTSGSISTFIRFLATPDQIVISSTANPLRINTNSLQFDKYTAFRDTTGTALFQLYNVAFDGVQPTIRNYCSWTAEVGTTDPIFLSRHNLIFRIDSNNDDTNRYFSVEHNAGTELFRVGEDGNAGIGETSPDTKLHIKATDGTGAITLDEESTTPSNPDQDTQGRIYFKSNKIVFQWNDGGTTRYKYLDLTGTGVTWVHSTTAP